MKANRFWLIVFALFLAKYWAADTSMLYAFSYWLNRPRA